MSDARERRFLVIAGKAEEANHYRRENGLTRKQVRYVGSEASIRGLQLDDCWTIVRVGTWDCRRDLPQINEAIRIASLASSSQPRQL